MLFLYAFFKSAFLEFITIKSNLVRKNVSFVLLNHYFLNNLNSNIFRLFVDCNNEKAIKFYKRAGFQFNDIKLIYYGNF